MHLQTKTIFVKYLILLTIPKETQYESINLTIGDILRINKGGDLKEAVEGAKTRLNYSYHQILKASPIELIEKKNPFNPLFRYINKLDSAIESSRKSGKIENKRLNQKRKIA